MQEKRFSCGRCITLKVIAEVSEVSVVSAVHTHCKPVLSAKLAQIIAVIFFSTSAAVGAVGGVPTACPGLLAVGAADVNCTAACQATTCRALLAFYNSTYSTEVALKSWRKRNGWTALLTSDCSQILAAAGPQPSYCSWHGITCNSSTSVVALSVEVNGLSGNIGRPVFMHSIIQLHHCGLVNLSLHSNALTGSMTDDWAYLTRLESLSLGELAAICNHSKYTAPALLRLPRRFRLQLQKQA